LRQVVLHADAVAVLDTELLAQAEQGVGDPAGHIGEHEVGHRFVGASQSLRECAKQMDRDARALQQHRTKIVMVERSESAVRDSGRCRRTRPGIEQRQLAEHLAGTEHRQQVLAPVRGGARDLHLAVEDDEQAVAGIAFAENDMAAVHVARRHDARQCGGRVLIEGGEQRNLGEDALHVTSTSTRCLFEDGPGSDRPSRGVCRTQPRAARRRAASRLRRPLRPQ
jgi:hypothetical protein